MSIRIIAAACAVAAAALVGAPAAAAEPPYANCSAARADGASDLTPSDPGYSSKLDRDGDGVACES